MRYHVKSPVRSPVRYHVKSPVRSPVRYHVKSPVRSPVRYHVKSPVRYHVKSPVRYHVKSPVRYHVKSPVKYHVKSPVRSPVRFLQCVSEAMASLSDVVAIFDMDGFLINKKFFCKEFGIIRVGDVAARSYFFDIEVNWRDLSAKDRKTCAYVINHVHKLPFGVPPGVKPYSISALENIVSEQFKAICKSENSVIGYKGGHYKKDLLASLSIPAIDLENYGCPKAKDLMKTMVWLETCCHHLVPDAYFHCPKVEVEAYAQWLGNIIY